MPRPRQLRERFRAADSIDWSFAGLFFAFGMVAAGLLHVWWG